jgi:hypothetical protein
MSKLLSLLVAAVFAVSTGSVFAAKHEGAAPGEKKAEMKKEEKAAPAKDAKAPKKEKKEKKAKEEMKK